MHIEKRTHSPKGMSPVHAILTTPVLWIQKGKFAACPHVSSVVTDDSVGISMPCVAVMSNQCHECWNHTDCKCHVKLCAVNFMNLTALTANFTVSFSQPIPLVAESAVKTDAEVQCPKDTAVVTLNKANRT